MSICLIYISHSHSHVSLYKNKSLFITSILFSRDNPLEKKSIEMFFILYLLICLFLNADIQNLQLRADSLDHCHAYFLVLGFSWSCETSFNHQAGSLKCYLPSVLQVFQECTCSVHFNTFASDPTPVDLGKLAVPQCVSPQQKFVP